MMIAHGFTIDQMVELVRAGLASASAERVRAGSKTIERCASPRRGGRRS